MTLLHRTKRLGWVLALTSPMAVTGRSTTVVALDALPRGTEGTKPLSQGHALESSSEEVAREDEREMTSHRTMEPSILEKEPSSINT